MKKLDEVIPYFEQVRLTSAHWPIESVAMIAGTKAQAKWSAFPKAATLSNGRLGHGAGLSSSEAATRAAGELVEIASCCAWGDEQLLCASPLEVAGESWDPRVVAGFSDEQFKDRNT